MSYELLLVPGKRYKMACAPIKDSVQPRLVRVFGGYSMGSQGSDVSSCRKLRLIRLCGCADWFSIFTVRTTCQLVHYAVDWLNYVQ